MSSSANGKEVGEAMTVDADCGSAWAVVESMTLEASQDSDVDAPALAMADSPGALRGGLDEARLLQVRQRGGIRVAPRQGH